MVQAHRTSSNLLEPPELARSVAFFHRSSGSFDCTEPSLLTSFQGKQVCRVRMHSFGVVQEYRTSSNLLEPQHRSDSKLYRVLSQELGVDRQYRTFSNDFFTGETRFAGCLSARSGWFTYSKPPRTFSNHIIAELTRCVEIVHRRSVWFD